MQFPDDVFDLAVFLRLARLSRVKSRITFFAPEPTFHHVTCINASKAVRVIVETMLVLSKDGCVGKTGSAQGKRVGLSVGKRARVPQGYVQVLMMLE